MEYVEIIVPLAAALPKVAAPRGGLRIEVVVSPTMNEAGIASRVDEAYRQMVVKWARG